jgi:predicted component of type VI protein secretion system
VPTAAGPAAPPARPTLATLEVTSEGVLKGRTFELRTPLVHVGRGAHNDVVLPDDSVSDSHAKIQRRDAGWYVVDMGSTNGTYVGGRRIGAEQQLGAQTDVRFGGVKLTFRVAAGPAPAAAPAGDVKGTRQFVGLSVGSAAAWPDVERRATPRGKVTADEGAERPAGGGGGGTAWVWVLLVILALAAGAFFLIQRG